METQEKRTYSSPELTQYGRLESITGAWPCTGFAHKEYNGAEDDVTPYGYLGTPMCIDG
jgi:hypothetical protein